MNCLIQNYAFTIREATVHDAPDIYSLMRNVQDELSDRSMYIISCTQRIKQKLETDCFGYLVYHNSEIVALYLFQKPASNDEENNLGFLIGLSEAQRSRVLILDSVAVRKPYRRLGISTLLFKLGVNSLESKCIQWLITTVDPRNDANLKCLSKLGFSIKRTIETYSNADSEYVLHSKDEMSNQIEQIQKGVVRHLLVKELL